MRVEKSEIKKNVAHTKKDLADRWSLEITGCSNICIATDDESQRAAKRSLSRALYPDEKDYIQDGDSR